MLIKEITQKDIPTWLAIAHEDDDIVARMVPDLAVFYMGFHDYIYKKINQHEAFKAYDTLSGKCIGIIAFSKKKNRITFLGIPRKNNFQTIGSRLMEYVIGQMDGSKNITACVPDSTAGAFQKERNFYKSLSFIETSDRIMENGIQAILMARVN